MPSSQRGHNSWDPPSTDHSFMQKLRKACDKFVCVKEFNHLKAGTNVSAYQLSRFLCPPWQKVQLESKELMAACLRKIPGLSKVKLIGDSQFDIEGSMTGTSSSCHNSFSSILFALIWMLSVKIYCTMLPKSQMPYGFGLSLTLFAFT